jgi:hypothetical protein
MQATATTCWADRSYRASPTEVRAVLDDIPMTVVGRDARESVPRCGAFMATA